MIQFIAAVDPLGGGLILGFLVLFIGAVWIFFPFLLLNKCNAIIKQLKELALLMQQIRQSESESNDHLAHMRKYYEPQPPPIPVATGDPKDAQYHGD
jgi:hypothetical protein